MRKGDLISRSDIMMYLDKRKTYEMMDGRNKAYGKGVRDAMKDIESAPAVEAVPLEPLCEWLAGYAAPPVRSPLAVHGDLKTAWKSFVRELMEEEHD